MHAAKASDSATTPILGARCGSIYTHVLDTSAKLRDVCGKVLTYSKNPDQAATWRSIAPLLPATEALAQQFDIVIVGEREESGLVRGRRRNDIIAALTLVVDWPAIHLQPATAFQGHCPSPLVILVALQLPSNGSTPNAGAAQARASCPNRLARRHKSTVRRQGLSMKVGAPALGLVGCSRQRALLSRTHRTEASW